MYSISPSFGPICLVVGWKAERFAWAAVDRAHTIYVVKVGNTEDPKGKEKRDVVSGPGGAAVELRQLASQARVSHHDRPKIRRFGARTAVPCWRAC